MLARKEWDSDYIEARREFIGLRDATLGLAFWAAEEHKGSRQLGMIRNTLNDYELIAVGIKEGILDEALYKRWFKTALLKDWKASENFVRAVRLRESSAAMFVEFEWLARKWSAPAQPELPLDDQSKQAPG